MGSTLRISGKFFWWLAKGKLGKYWPLQIRIFHDDTQARSERLRLPFLVFSHRHLAKFLGKHDWITPSPLGENLFQKPSSRQRADLIDRHHVVVRIGKALTGTWTKSVRNPPIGGSNEQDSSDEHIVLVAELLLSLRSLTKCGPLSIGSFPHFGPSSEEIRSGTVQGWHEGIAYGAQSVCFLEIRQWIIIEADGLSIHRKNISKQLMIHVSLWRSDEVKAP
ncbi:predicted protein [Histoplasma capsulatum G186AR]|uniref:Uncharacterized protein n=1 Tax=Ajellomyces capsulatus (strain G186AR / H82 / ATCC MYA-2454 / RMSCC 2432) TaxID=447093 RepID=C0NTU1_AJECG|nr:uncharacterized protein HCBG_06571 [Histoplasma capsulatum G186AR]EEH05452.1 predicted protein [Histoplasma capsulatum G186AR]